MGDSEVFPKEPEEVYPEEKFEEALNELFKRVKDRYRRTTIVPKFGLDFAFFCSDTCRTRVTFVEVKSYGGQRQGGIGFGNGKGEGPQVDILLSDSIDLLDKCVRWAFADATRNVCSPRYALLNCTEAKAVAMNGVAKGKQNNFRVSALSQHFVSWEEFCKRLLKFLCGLPA